MGSVDNAERNDPLDLTPYILAFFGFIVTYIVSLFKGKRAMTSAELFAQLQANKADTDAAVADAAAKDAAAAAADAARTAAIATQLATRDALIAKITEEFTPAV